MHSCHRSPQTSQADGEYVRLLRRIVDPPQQVDVELGAILTLPRTVISPLPFRVRQGGVRLAGVVPGELLAWARVFTGHWIALVRCDVPTGSGSLPLLQWVPETAVRPRQADPFHT